MILAPADLSVHHVWMRLVETLSEAKDKSGPVFVKFSTEVLLIFNSNNAMCELVKCSSTKFT